MKLIDKIRAEVEKRITETESMQPKFDQFWAGQISAFKGVLKILDSLETKEVDLEKEIEEVKHYYKVDNNRHTTICSADIEWLAKHFFNLGSKAQKGE